MVQALYQIVREHIIMESSRASGQLMLNPSTADTVMVWEKLNKSKTVDQASWHTSSTGEVTAEGGWETWPPGNSSGASFALASTCSSWHQRHFFIDCVPKKYCQALGQGWLQLGLNPILLDALIAGRTS